jgi:hypothetical protein
MRKLIIAAVAASIASIPLAAAVNAEETTVIHKDNGYGDQKTVIKKHENGLFGGREEKKVIVHHDHDHDY